MINIKTIGYIIICIVVGVFIFGVIGLAITEMVHSSPISKKTNYLHTGEIINVHFTEHGTFVRSITIVQFENDKYLKFYDRTHYEIHESPNATIHYSVNKYDRMFFNDIKYGDN